MTRTIRGIVEVPAGDRPRGPVRVVVRIEDTSRADAPATVLASRTFEVTLSTQDEVELPFEVPVDDDALEAQASYTIRAHLDVSGSGSIERGDYLSTVATPVLTPGAPDPVRLAVRRLG